MNHQTESKVVVVGAAASHPRSSKRQRFFYVAIVVVVFRSLLLFSEHQFLMVLRPLEIEATTASGIPSKKTTDNPKDEKEIKIAMDNKTSLSKDKQDKEVKASLVLETTIISNNSKSLPAVLQPEQDPPCKYCLFMVWTGPPKLPLMYEVALQTSIKAYGVENIVICSTTLDQVKDWYPVIWNVSAYDLTPKLTEFHNLTVWNNFIDRLEIRAHYADFMRIALIHLYGGVYADFDSIWIRALPLEYPIPSGEHQNKTVLRVRQDERKNYRGKRIKTNDPSSTSNTILGGAKNTKFYRLVLEWMPIGYDPKLWVGIGGHLLGKSYRECNCTEDMLEIEYRDMLGIFGYDAPRLYNSPLGEKDKSLRDHVINKAYQIHMFGSKTKVASGNHPVNGSLYALVLDSLGISASTPNTSDWQPKQDLEQENTNALSSSNFSIDTGNTTNMQPLWNDTYSNNNTDWSNLPWPTSGIINCSYLVDNITVVRELGRGKRKVALEVILPNGVHAAAKRCKDKRKCVRMQLVAKEAAFFESLQNQYGNQAMKFYGYCRMRPYPRNGFQRTIQDLTIGETVFLELGQPLMTRWSDWNNQRRPIDSDLDSLQTIARQYANFQYEPIVLGEDNIYAHQYVNTSEGIRHVDFDMISFNPKFYPKTKSILQHNCDVLLGSFAGLEANNTRRIQCAS